jgi:DNA mismatch repair protein MutL
MPRIEQLSDSVANQIAAGEVVERPAAVVKELVENALDAGATQIEVEFRHGGKSYLRVTDNGHGMDPEDALRALQRHATSKLREARDLLSLGSFGFRGEALPSIASVSRFTLRTREAQAEGGTEVFVDGTRPPEVKACGMAPGTSVEVARLFQTVPARRKFLKTDRTEAAHIVQLCRLFAVAHPAIGFTLLEDGQVRFRAAPGSSLTERVREVFNRQLAEELIPIVALEPDPANAGVTVSGLIGKPGTGRATRAELFTFVNRRPVDSRVLNYALLESFHTYIPKGRYPASFLFVEVPPAAVDVNVHPTKREVRFRDDPQVRAAVMDAVLSTLRSATRGRLAEARAVDDARPLAPARSSSPEASAPTADPAPGRPLGAGPRPPLPPLRGTGGIAPPPRGHHPAPLPTGPEDVPYIPRPDPVTPRPEPKQSLDWRLLGRSHERLALFQSREGIIVLHLPAAAERVAYETFLQQWARSAIPVQSLLFPLSLEFDPVRADILGQHLDFFHSLGLEVEPFGRHFFRLRTAPQAFAPEAAKAFLTDLVALIAERGLRPGQEDAVRETVGQLAARRLARVSEKWDDARIEHLAQRLLACAHPLADPQGRPTFFEIPRREWEKRLGL